MKEPVEAGPQSDYCLLQRRVGAIIERHGSESQISPAWIATEAINEIDPLKFDIKSIPHFYRAAHLALTRIARELLGMPDDDRDDGKSPDEILAEGEAQLRDREGASGLPKEHVADKVILLGLKRNRPCPAEEDTAISHTGIVAPPRAWQSKP